MHEDFTLKPVDRKVKDRNIRITYTVTMAGNRPINTFIMDRSLVDLVGYLNRNFFNFSDLVKIIKTEYIVNQYDDTFEKFVKVEDITDKVIGDTIPKVLGRKAEKINFDKLEKLK
jgi:hypothetical protein